MHAKNFKCARKIVCVHYKLSSLGYGGIQELGESKKWGIQELVACAADDVRLLAGGNNKGYYFPLQVTKHRLRHRLGIGGIQEMGDPGNWEIQESIIGSSYTKCIQQADIMT